MANKRLSIANGSEALQMESDTVLFVEAMQNYVSICYTDNTEIKQAVIRNTIKALEQTFANTGVIRCHRSFLVNRNLIEHTSGNAQGLKLQLTGLHDKEIHVSRKYTTDFR